MKSTKQYCYYIEYIFEKKTKKQNIPEPLPLKNIIFHICYIRMLTTYFIDTVTV